MLCFSLFIYTIYCSSYFLVQKKQKKKIFSLSLKILRKNCRYAALFFCLWYHQDMKRMQFIPNIITAFGLSCGLYAIFKMSMMSSSPGDYETMFQVALILLVAALADFIDGALARAISAESTFGFMFDSLADAVSFGVAPSVLFLKGLALEPGSLLSFFAAASAMIYSLCGILRLVRFSTVHAAKTSRRSHFTGLPITAAAAGSVSVSLLFLSPEIQNINLIDDQIRAYIVAGLLVFLGYLMVSRWKFPSAKFLRFPIPSFSMIVGIAVLAVFVLYMALHYFSLLFALLAWSYILTAATLSCIRILMGKTAKSLKGFEPDDRFRGSS